MSNRKKYVLWVCISLVLVLVGSFAANRIQTDFCKVKITDMSFVTEDGARLRALLLVPDSATVEKPAPAVVSAHGYNNTLEVQDLNWVELSRRGYVVMTIDHYDHGLSSFPDKRINKGIAADMGTYAALQYLGSLPYVDKKNIGMVGHSMGGSTIQLGALRAFKTQEKNPAVIVPKALMPTSQSFLVVKDVLPYAQYPVSVGVVFGQYDEWADNMWGVPKGSLVNTSKKAKVGMGFAEPPEYGALYLFGNNKKLTPEEAIAAAAEGKPLRAMYSPNIEHPKTHFSQQAETYILDFFNVTLKGGKEALPASDQIWPWKQFFNGLTLVGFFLFVIPFAFLMLEVPYFKTIIQPEPASPSVMQSSNSKLVYWILFIVCMLPAPLILNWAVGYPIGIKSMGRFVPTVFPTSDYFQLPAVNGTVLLMLIVGAVLLAIFILTYLLYMKKNGATFKDLGVKISGSGFWKSLLLALIVFVATYMLLVIANYFFLTDARFWVFSLKTLNPIKWYVFLKYVPFFLFFYLVNILLLNSFTRIRGAGEATNIILMIIANVGGLAVMSFLDYWWLFSTGVKLWPDVPFPPKMTSALAGILLWNLLFILPLAAVSARLFFRKTGSIWFGGFVNALVVTLFAISNTVSSAGVL